MALGGAGLIGAGQFIRKLSVKVAGTQRMMRLFPEREAGRLANEIRVGITSQAPGGKAFQALAQATIDARRRRRGKASTKALIDSGSMREAVTHQQVETGVWFVGLLRTQVHRTAGTGEITMANLGYIHEVVGVKAGKGRKLRIRRPFIVPTYEVFRKGSLERFSRDVSAPWRGR